MTRDFSLTEEWALIQEGPTTDGLFIEAALRSVFFRVETSTPTSSIGHRLDEDTHGQAVTLTGTDNLYARATEGAATAVVTGL